MAMRFLSFLTFDTRFMKKNRWLIALAAIGIHLCIGSVYAWSVFTKPLQAKFGWSMSETQLTFGLAIFMLGISAAFMGRVVERRGPRVSGLLAMAFWCGGLAGAGLAVSGVIQSERLCLYLLYGSYGILGGIGLGTGYVTPVSALIKWFPDRRGLATGLAIMGFGFAAFLGAPLISQMISLWGLDVTFWGLSLIYLVIMGLSAAYLEVPPQGWVPDTREKSLKAAVKRMDLMPMRAASAIRTAPFYGLWVMMYINITCGIALISVASPLTQDMTGVTPLAAAGVVGMIGLFNGAGRIGWASLSDWLGRPQTFIVFFVLEIASFLLMPSLNEIVLFQVALYLIMTCYGGGFATLPAYIGDLFGTQEVSAIHGYVLTAWAFAGLSGSSLAAALRESTGSYLAMMQVFSGVFGAALLVAIAMSVFVSCTRNRLLKATGA